MELRGAAPDWDAKLDAGHYVGSKIGEADEFINLVTYPSKAMDVTFDL